MAPSAEPPMPSTSTWSYACPTPSAKAVISRTVARLVDQPVEAVLARGPAAADLRLHGAEPRGQLVEPRARQPVNPVERVLQHPPVGQPDHGTSTVSPSYAGKMPGGSCAGELRVPGLVRQMGEIGAARAERLRGLDRLRDAQVRRMRAPPQRVEHQRRRGRAAGAARPRGHGLHVGDVGQRAEAIAEHPEVAVAERERQHLDAGHLDRRGRARSRAAPGSGFEVPSYGRTVVEDVAEASGAAARAFRPGRTPAAARRWRTEKIAQIVDAVRCGRRARGCRPPRRRAVTPPAMSCRRSSGGVSIRIVAPSRLDHRADRVRLSRGSVERQTAQSQPIWGTPNDVPVPRKVSRMS